MGLYLLNIVLSSKNESFIIDLLKPQLQLDSNQYGSTKGVGTEHYLIHVWDYLLEHLEDPNSSVNLNLPMLQSRRDNLLDKFACKLRDSPRFSAAWLPERIFTGYDLREERIFNELRATTERRRKSPLFEIRRRLNNI